MSVEAVSDNAERRRFERRENGLLTFADYRLADGVLHIPHVETDPALRGAGAAGRLMAGIAAHARAHGLKIAPHCPYAAAWFRRHPEERDLLG